MKSKHNNGRLVKGGVFVLVIIRLYWLTTITSFCLFYTGIAQEALRVEYEPAKRLKASILKR